MVSFKDLGFSLNLGGDWTETDEVFEDIKPYLYAGYKTDGIYCFVLQYGRGQAGNTQDYVDWAVREFMNSSGLVLFEEKSLMLIDCVEQPYYKKLTFDESKSIYNLKFFTNFSKRIGVWGCLDFYFSNKDDLKIIEKIIDEKFRFLGE